MGSGGTLLLTRTSVGGFGVLVGRGSVVPPLPPRPTTEPFERLLPLFLVLTAEASVRVLRGWRGRGAGAVRSSAILAPVQKAGLSVSPAPRDEDLGASASWAASSVVAATAVRWPILRPGRASAFP